MSRSGGGGRDSGGSGRRIGAALPLTVALAAIIVVLVILLSRGGSGDDQVVAPVPTPTPTLDPLDASVFFLEVTSPAQAESLIEAPALTVTGRTRADAVVSVNDQIVSPDADGRFSAVLTLDVGVNVIEVVASLASSEQLEEVLAVIYTPPE